ncbi:nodulation protein NfeD [Melioribacteraceae bacterium 4301-Me]|uniref:NfeD family protein n=1 Tax=Pyranulibacter aquaticus TaxID=3163344 RepID=UPI00359B3216
MNKIAKGKIQNIKKLFLLYLILAVSSYAQQNTVYIADITGDIDLSMAPYVRRVINEAEKNNVKAIVFRINTFGGRVDAATQIKDAILNSKIKTIALVDKRAISAGSLIALSCQKIVMTPGSSIGATTVVNQSGEKQSEKYQSYMRSEMRATAEKNGKRPDVAEGMVDERIVIPGLVDSTKLITLTYDEAVKWGIADTVLPSLESALLAFGYGNDKVVKIDTNWAEDLVRFLNNPIISSILIIIGLLGLFTEIKTPGWGLPGTVSLIALALFFGSGYILQLASLGEILIFVIGVILLLLEIFVIPGFGIAGILGIVLIIVGLFLGLIPDFNLAGSTFISKAAFQLALTFVATAAAIFVLSRFLPKSNLWNNLILKTNIDVKSGYTSDINLKDLINLGGIAITDLRPSGIAVVNGKRLDVVTEGDYIKRNTPIIVIQVIGSKIIVSKK